MQRETRALGRVETREDEDTPRLTGYAAVFDRPTDIAGVFRERIAPGAFAEAIGRDDVRALLNHDDDHVLGRTRSGTLRLAEDETGLSVEIDPPDTQLARDLQVSIARGDISQMSFAFIARAERWEDVDTAMPLRTIEAVELFDVSVVTFPAYPDTSIAVRALQAQRATRRSPAALGVRLRMDLGLRARTRLQRSAPPEAG